VSPSKTKPVVLIVDWKDPRQGAATSDDREEGVVFSDPHIPLAVGFVAVHGRL